MPSHYYDLKQCWDIVKWTLRNKLQWNFNQNTELFIHEKSNNHLQNGSHFVQGRWVNQPQTIRDQLWSYLQGKFMIGSINESRRRYRQTKNNTEWTQWQIIWYRLVCKFSLNNSWQIKSLNMMNERWWGTNTATKDLDEIKIYHWNFFPYLKIIFFKVYGLFLIRFFS